MIYFFDVDGTLADPGSDVLRPGVVDTIRELYRHGHQVWLWTCRPTGPWVREFRGQGLWMEGVIQKPFCEGGYVVVDDKLVEGRRAL
jgi:hydroxymethylpyrimidine pyrophosphatase-like HAD family hydrolase